MTEKEKGGKVILYLIIIVLAVAALWEAKVLFKQRQELVQLREKVRPPMHLTPQQMMAGPMGSMFQESWDPVSEMRALQLRMNRMFDETFFLGMRAGLPAEWITAFASFSPSFDLEETDKEYIVRGDLPGLDKEQVNVVFRNQVLTISGKRDITKELKAKRGEFFDGAGSFSRRGFCRPGFGHFGF